MSARAWLDRVQDPAEDQERAHLALVAVLLMHFAGRGWQVAWGGLAGSTSWLIGLAALLAMALGLAGLKLERTRWVSSAIYLSLLQLAWQVLTCFPIVPNHLYLELVLAGILAVYSSPTEENRRLSLTAVRWVTLIVLAWTGMQKALWGTWFQGEFLASAIGSSPSMAQFFGPLLAPDELARIAALSGEVGEGPYRLSSPLALLASNLAWVLEIVLPLLCLRRAWRPWAALSAMGLIVVIEVAVVELHFGSLFVGLLLCTAGRDWLPRAWPAWAVFGMLLAVAQLLTPGSFN